MLLVEEFRSFVRSFRQTGICGRRPRETETEELLLLPSLSCANEKKREGEKMIDSFEIKMTHNIVEIITLAQ